MKRSIIALLAIFTAAACQQLVESLPEPANLQGSVSSISTNETLQLGLEDIASIEGGSGEYPSGTIIHGSADTRILREQSGELEPISRDEIQVGDMVRVWIDAELRSDPPQYSAIQIVVMRN